MRRIATALVAVAAFVSAALAEISPEIRKGLEESTYVYVSSTRKDGSLSKAAEIWFLWHEGAVYVATPPSSWRVKRIKAGRTDAKIWVGKPDGPAFEAKGELAAEPAVHAVMFETFAKKYGSRWESYEERFRAGLADGSRVLVKYTPK